MRSPRRCRGRSLLPVDALEDPHHLADSDPEWAGGDVLRIRQVAAAVTPRMALPVLELLRSVPGPVVGAVRTGLDILIGLKPKARPALPRPAHNVAVWSTRSAP